MRKLAVVACMLSAVLMTGCISIQVGTERNSSGLQIKGLANGYVTLGGIDSYSGKILKFGLFSGSEGSGEVASLDLWPMFGVGVGVVGARVQVLPLQVGLGTLFYEPKPKVSHKPAEARKLAPSAPTPAPPPPPVVPPAPPPPAPPM